MAVGCWQPDPSELLAAIQSSPAGSQCQTTEVGTCPRRVSEILEKLHVQCGKVLRNLVGCFLSREDKVTAKKICCIAERSGSCISAIHQAEALLFHAERKRESMCSTKDTVNAIFNGPKSSVNCLFFHSYSSEKGNFSPIGLPPFCDTHKNLNLGGGMFKDKLTDWGHLLLRAEVLIMILKDMEPAPLIFRVAF